MLLKVVRITFAMGVGVVLAFALFGVATFYGNLKGRGKDD